MKTKILITLIFIIFTFIFVQSAEAVETQIFYDDFESGIDNWDLGQGWSVILDNGNHVLQGTQHTFTTTYLEGVPNKLELKLKLLQGAIHINIRSKPTPEGLNRYFIGLNEGGSYIQKQINNDFQPLKNGKGISLNEWHNIKIEIIGSRIDVFVDDNLVLSVQDKDLLNEGDISFETHDNSIAYVDDVKVEMSVPEAREFKAQDIFPNGEHKGDLTLDGRGSLILENGNFEQFGNIYLKGKSKLIIRDSTFKITRYQRLLNHWGIYLEDRASLEIDNSKLMPSSGETLFIIYARDGTSVNMTDSPTKIHLFSMFGKAKAVVESSEIVGDIGGLVGAYDNADVKVINSRIGAVNLRIPNGATFEASGLGTGFFEKWNLHENTKVSGINYNITLINTELVKDTIGPGPYERGWPVFIESGANVKIKDSELRKVVIDLYDEKTEFSNFSLEKPTNFNYRNINLENVKVMGQWGIFLHGSSDVVIRDSEAFWTFIFDDSKLTLINTHMNEFDPRNFRGEMIFENSRWDTAAEILENNNFTMSGSLEIGNIGGFSWENSKVTRIYDLIGKPNSELTLRKGEEIVWQGKTDENGKATFSLRFDDTTFDDSWLIQDNFGNENNMTFFSKTPVDIQQNIISKFIQKLELAGPSPILKLVTPILVVVLIIFFLFFWKKYLKKKK